MHIRQVFEPYVTYIYITTYVVYITRYSDTYGAYMSHQLGSLSHFLTKRVTNDLKPVEMQ